MKRMLTEYFKDTKRDDPYSIEINGKECYIWKNQFEGLSVVGPNGDMAPVSEDGKTLFKGNSSTGVSISVLSVDDPSLKMFLDVTRRAVGRSILHNKMRGGAY